MDKLLKEEIFRMQALAGVKVNSPSIEEDILSEGVNFSATLNKIKDYAKKGLLTTALITSLMSSDAFSSEEKDIIKNVAGSEVTAPNPAPNPVRAPVRVSPDVKGEWNKFVDFLDDKGLKGNTKLNFGDTQMIELAISEFQKNNPNTTISMDIVSDIQNEISIYREKVLVAVQQGKAKFAPGVTPENFMMNLSKVDGRAGSLTTKFKFPDEMLNKNNQRIRVGFADADKFWLK